ncbi:hypothetical protein PanWU01x14_137630 [Parasponia andersonii]|uniref:Uncharacterized protein n=1 Tax=Parasponia andersonii TaxID=3476 RepID=A0A2P5CNM4_PARAD|nr:hypothetical protein PanWU01x14_137630 [Parasponia andersonii]
MICNILTPSKTLSTCSGPSLQLHLSLTISTPNPEPDNWNLVLDTLEPVQARAGSHFGSIACAV